MGGVDMFCMHEWAICRYGLKKFPVAWRKSQHLDEEFDKHITSLREQRDRIHSEVEYVISGRAEFYFDSDNEIHFSPKDWLRQADKVLEEAMRLKDDIKKNVSSLTRCLHMKRGKEERMIGKIKRLLENAKSIEVDRPTPTRFFLSKSFNSAFDNTMKALTNDGVNMIAVWGMAGVGKTTLVKKVVKETSSSSFSKFIVVRVSQTPNIEKIQDRVADILELRLGALDMESREEQLRRSLEEQKVLIILDDVWDVLDLKAIGIPHRKYHKECKIILTTRFQQVCIRMGVQEVITLDLLSDVEACRFLKDKTRNGYIVDKAKELVKECQGLPSAMVYLGDHDRRDVQYAIQSWCMELRSSKVWNGECLPALLRTCSDIRLSYDSLSKSTTKKCFLLCSLLFPQDYAIDVEVLTRYAWGVQLYEAIGSVNKVRCEVRTEITTLISSSLLLDHGHKGVKMHKLVRYCALWIALSIEKVPFIMELDEIGPIDESLGAVSERYVGDEKLEMLLLDGGSSHSSIKSFIARLEGMKSLKGFAIRDEHLSAASLETLTNLRVLYLVHCQLDDFSSLRKLQNLEILSFRGSDISELPDQIAEILNHIRLLDLWGCHNLKRIPLNMLRKLSQLEELFFNFQSLEEWWFKEKGEEVMGSSLEILIDIDLSHDNSNSRTIRVTGFSRNIARKLYEEHLTLQGLECSELKELPPSRCTWNQLPDYVKLQNLTILTVAYSDRLISLFSFPVAQSMVNLEKLKISDCKELKQIISEPSSDGYVRVIFSDSSCLPRLETLEINRCEKLEFVFHSAMASFAPQLNELKIVDCPRLTYLVFVGKDHVALRNLKQVSLQGLDGFSTFCLETSSICLTYLEMLSIDQLPSFETFPMDLPSLETLEVRKCPQLTHAISEIIKQDKLKRLSLVKVGRELYEELFQLKVGYFLSNLEELIIEGIQELKVIWKDSNQIISLQNLTCLKVVRCNRLKHIFSVQLARNLPQLEHLEVVECDEMEQVISKDQKASAMASRKPEYFPNLEVICIMKCNRLKYLFPLSASCFPKLKKLQVENACNLIQIFEHEIEENIKVNKQEAKLPALEELSLKRLHNFMAFSSVGYYFVFPSLRSLEVIECPCRIMDFYYDKRHSKYRTEIKIDNRDSYFLEKVGNCVNEDIRKCEQKSNRVPVTPPKKLHPDIKKRKMTQ